MTVTNEKRYLLLIKIDSMFLKRFKGNDVVLTNDSDEAYSAEFFDEVEHGEQFAKARGLGLKPVMHKKISDLQTEITITNVAEIRKLKTVI